MDSNPNVILSEQVGVNHLEDGTDAPRLLTIVHEDGSPLWDVHEDGQRIYRSKTEADARAFFGQRLGK